MSTNTQILYQIIFGSKDYIFFLNEKNKDVLFRYIAAICRKRKCKPYIVGGYGNHIHMIISLHPSKDLSSLVKEVKNGCHYMMSKESELFKDFPGWQVGYGAFTYNYSSKINLIRYVEGQDEHHRKVTFQDELIAFCRKFGIDYDARYLII